MLLVSRRRSMTPETTAAGATRETAGPMLGILIPEFPSQTHIFFWREIEALRAMGQRVGVISTRRPSASCRHDFAAGAAAETHYLYPPRPVVAAVLAARPARTLAAARYLLGLEASSLRRRVAGLGLLACAADLLQHSQREGIEHIHAHSCAEAAHVVALCRILGGPTYSLTLHGDLSVYGTDHGSKMARATFVATDGPHLTEQIVSQAGIPAERVLPTWMGLDIDRFRDAGLRVFEAGRLHLVTVARLNRSKGHRHALAAMRVALDRGADLRYTLAGDGPHREEIEADVRRLGLSDRVEFAGSLSESAVLDLLQRADAFVLPSVGLGEAGPISLMEAMACGLPAVSSIIGATPVMVEHGVEGLLVPQGDEGALADAFVRLAVDPEGRRRIGEAARRRAVACFDRRDTARRLLDAIQGRHRRDEGLDPVGPDRQAGPEAPASSHER
jgi:colanic acid/amylovoran biosynthesis glycosyltransferase